MPPAIPGPAAPDPSPSPALDAGTPPVTTEPPPPGDGRVELEQDWPPGTRSLEVRAVAHVIGEPSDEARYIGKITRGTRVAWRRVVAPDDPPAGSRKKRKRCPAWVEIEPEGYLCKSFLRPSTEAPHGARQPVVPNGRLIPNAYFKVTADDTKVYESTAHIEAELAEKTLSTKIMLVGSGMIDVGGVQYRKTDHGLVDAAALRRLWPSPFEGQSLGSDDSPSLPFAWVYYESWTPRPWIRERPDPKSPGVRRAGRREIVPVLEQRDGYAKVGPSEWIDRKHLRVAARTTPPPAHGGSAQWIDVDLDEQVIVAYDGLEPVFATLVSSGRAKNRTPVATYRVRAKAATTPMAGDPSTPNRYEVSAVPWAIRFADGLYIHAAYWHDGFGGTRSHGCVNVSPKDAHFLFDWIAPHVPAGWSEVEVPGGRGVLVRIRDRDHPTPTTHDYTAEEPWNAPDAVREATNN